MIPNGISRLNRERTQLEMLLSNFKCFDMGEIIQLPDVNSKYIKVRLGYQTNNIITNQQQILYCMATNILHNKAKYSVGDIVFIAYTDKKQYNFLQTKTPDISYTSNETHNIANGIILFSIEPYSKTTNNYVQTINDNAYIKVATTNNGEEITIYQGEDTQIKLDANGELSIQTKGKVKISNSSGGDLKTILDLMNQKIIAMATGIDASKPNYNWLITPNAAVNYGDQATEIAKLLK